MTVAYLYTRKKFGWAIQEFALFSTARTLISTLGNVKVHILCAEDAGLICYSLEMFLN
jgi:hypothetical protein